MSDSTEYLPGAGEGNIPQVPGAYWGFVAQSGDDLRVRLRVPQIMAGAVTGWALPMVPVTAAPPVGTRVVVMFAGGDVTQPLYGGNL